MHAGRFVEVHVATPVDVCAERDVKGLYAQTAGRVEITGLTGVDDPYEPPWQPTSVVPTQSESIDESVEQLWRSLRPEQALGAT